MDLTITIPNKILLDSIIEAIRETLSDESSRELEKVLDMPLTNSLYTVFNEFFVNNEKAPEWIEEYIKDALHSARTTYFDEIFYDETWKLSDRIKKIEEKLGINSDIEYSE